MTTNNVSHHGDGVVEERLPEHEDVQQLVNVDLLKHGQDGHRVHGRDDGAEEQAGQQVHAAQPGHLQLAHAVHHAAHEKGVPQGPNHCEHQDGAQVLREGADGQEVAGVQDDGRQQVEEEEPGLQDGGLFVHSPDGAAHQETHNDEQATLRHDVRHPGNDVKGWRDGWNV